MKNLLFIAHSILLLLFLKACGAKTEGEGIIKTKDTVDQMTDTLKTDSAGTPGKLMEMPSEENRPRGGNKSNPTNPVFEAPKHNAPGQEKIDSIKRSGKK